MKNITILLSLFISTYSIAQQPKGNRTLAWQVDMAENGNYDSAFLYSAAGCMESIHLAVNWSSLDTNDGQFNQSFIASILDVSNIYYPIVGVEVELQLATINTVTKETPKDLKNVAFDHPLMIKDRCKGFSLDNFETNAIIIW